MIRRLKERVTKDRQRQAPEKAPSPRELNPAVGAENSSDAIASIDLTPAHPPSGFSDSSPPLHDEPLPSHVSTTDAAALRPTQISVIAPGTFQDSKTDGLRLIYEAPKKSDVVADIVFLHGLTGGSRKTWLDKEATVFWPFDLLAKDAPNTRILAFDYDADVTKLLGPISQNNLRSHAEALLSDLAALRDDSSTDRPIIFIVHSLGGLVVKKALCISESSFETHINRVGRYTKAVAFLGTPHRGSDLTSFGLVIANILKVARKRVNTEILELLKPNNRILMDLEDSFGVWLRNNQTFNITCFYEELEFPGVGKVVPKDSAKVVGYVQIPIHANHQDMARFKSSTDSGYMRILGEIRRWLNNIRACSTGTTRERKPKEKEALRSIAFRDMNSRGDDINDAAAETCKWIFEHHDYQTWLSQHQSLLWIKGKPGSGKSTIMKHLLKCYENEVSTSSFVPLSFFFHGRGSLLQKTPVGLYRSILHQILDQLPDLLENFTKLFQREEDKLGKYGEEWDWTETHLKKFFRSYLSEAAKLTRLRLYIDALDEGGTASGRSLVVLLQDVMSTLPDDAALQLVFSCRHYPLLSLPGSLEIFMENENRQDIDRYTQNELRRYISDEDAVQSLKNAIISRDSGIFQWAVLMVSNVNDLYLNGTRLSKIHDAIETKPVHLHDLYRDLLENIESEKKQKSLQIIRWVLFAKRPLSLDELRHVIAVESSPASHCLDECLESGDCETNIELERRLRDLSRGLLEVVSVNRRGRTVQFIHQSVLDFVSEEGYGTLDNSLKSSLEFSGQSHLRISRTCIKYIGQTKLNPLRSWDEEEINLHLPLLIYAARYWVDHAVDVEAHNIQQVDLLSLFGWPASELWEVWMNAYLASSDSYVDPLFEKMDLLDVASQNGLTSVVRECLDRINQKKVILSADRWRRYKPPLCWAAEWGRESTVKMLLERHDVDVNSRPSGRPPPLWMAAKRGHLHIVKLLLGHSDIDVNWKTRTRCLLGDAYNKGKLDIMDILLARDDLDVNLPHQGKSLLVLAIDRNDLQLVKKLLERKDVNVNAQDLKGWTSTPLCWAAYYGRVKIVEMLLTHPSIDVNVKDAWGGNALEIAKFKVRREISRLLEAHGAAMPEHPPSRRTLRGAPWKLAHPSQEASSQC